MAAGEDVGHGVGLTSNMGDLVMIPVVVVVQAGQATKIGSGLVRGESPLVVLGDGSNIVIEGHKGEFLEIKKERGHISMCEDTGLLQVTVS